MSYPPRYALLLDGGFVIQKFLERTRPSVFPTADEIESLSISLGKHECVSRQSKLRTYFYHSKPSSEVLRNPISGAVTRLADTEVFRQTFTTGSWADGP